MVNIYDVENIEKRMIKRLGIFCFYDRDGIVDKYIEYILTDLKKILNELFIVVNGYINCKGFEIFQKYTDQIMIRENKGFDAGAYRDIIVEILGKEKVKEWDEIVLCNDTFYGPFISFEKIFQEMETRNADFWGLDYREGKFLSFVHSYFLVFRKQIIWNDELFKYLNDNIVSKSEEIIDIYASFEVGLFSYLIKHGYRYDSFVYTDNHNVYLNGDRCVEEYQLPILKRKCFSPQYYSEGPMVRVLNTIQKKYNYDINYILSNIYRLYGLTIYAEKVFNYGFMERKSRERKIPNLVVDEKGLLGFIQKYGDIYIYGTGIIARKIWFLFHLHMEHFNGYIVSDGQSMGKEFLYGYPIVNYKDVRPGCAFILAVGDEISKEVIPILKKEDKVLILWEGLAQNCLNNCELYS